MIQVIYFTILFTKRVGLPDTLHIHFRIVNVPCFMTDNMRRVSSHTVITFPLVLIVIYHLRF